jgi:hypothetical protein
MRCPTLYTPFLEMVATELLMDVLYFERITRC